MVPPSCFAESNFGWDLSFSCLGTNARVLVPIEKRNTDKWKLNSGPTSNRHPVRFSTKMQLFLLLSSALAFIVLTIDNDNNQEKTFETRGDRIHSFRSFDCKKVVTATIDSLVCTAQIDYTYKVCFAGPVRKGENYLIHGDSKGCSIDKLPSPFTLCAGRFRGRIYWNEGTTCGGRRWNRNYINEYFHDE